MEGFISGAFRVASGGPWGGPEPRPGAGTPPPHSPHGAGQPGASPALPTINEDAQFEELEGQFADDVPPSDARATEPDGADADGRRTRRRTVSASASATEGKGKLSDFEGKLSDIEAIERSGVASGSSSSGRSSALLNGDTAQQPPRAKKQDAPADPPPPDAAGGKVS